MTSKVLCLMAQIKAQVKEDQPPFLIELLIHQ
jgi:hypothetical protein